MSVSEKSPFCYEEDGFPLGSAQQAITAFVTEAYTQTSDFGYMRRTDALQGVYDVLGLHFQAIDSRKPHDDPGLIVVNSVVSAELQFADRIILLSGLAEAIEAANPHNRRSAQDRVRVELMRLKYEQSVDGDMKKSAVIDRLLAQLPAASKRDRIVRIGEHIKGNILSVVARP